MLPYQRRLEMLKLLEQHEVVSLNDFCEALEGVSKSTVRRDLKAMEADGQIMLLQGGGACLKDDDSYEVPLNSKSIKNINEKELIASYAASLVEDGDAIYLDSGSTALHIIRHLRDKQITVVTTNAAIIPELQETKLKCILIGGEVMIDTGSILGMTTNTELETMYFDKAFIGANGFSEKAGITTPDIREAQKKQIVYKNSNKTYVLADSSKSGKSTLCKVFDLGEVPIICEKETDVLIASKNYLIAK